MSLPSPSPAAPPPRRAQAQTWLSALAALGLLLPLCGLILLGLWRWSQQGPGAARAILTLAGVVAMSALVLSASAWAAAQADRGAALTRSPLFRLAGHPLLPILLTPPLLALGAWLSRQEGPVWLLFPLVHVLAVGLPLWWFLRIGLRRLPVGPPGRWLGAFSVGLLLTPPLILLAEGGLLLFAIMGAAGLLALNPAWQAQMEVLFHRLQYAPSPQVMQRVLLPYLQSPLVLYAGVAGATAVVALIEEALKPLAVWRLVSRPEVRPVDGFLFGALSGAGFAYYETLTVALAPGLWLPAVLGRIGTGWLHISTAALTGWGMALAWRERRYLRLGVVYLLAVMLHSLWNALSLSAVISTLAAAPFLRRLWPTTGPLGLSALTLGLLLWWLSSTRHLRRTCYNVGSTPTDFEEPDELVEISA